MAKAYLEAADTAFTINNANVLAYGHEGSQAVTLSSSAYAVAIDQNIEEVIFPKPSYEYTYEQTGNIITVRLNGLLIATITTQGDADGTKFTFANGSVGSILTGGVMKLGAASSTAIEGSNARSIDSKMVIPAPTPAPTPAPAPDPTPSPPPAPPSDTTAPTLSSSSPIDNATAVATNSNIVLTFSENVSAVAGKNVTIKKTSDNSTAATIDAADGQITVAANVATINPTINLGVDTEYYVLIDSGAFKDSANNGYAGISSTTALSFRTVANANVSLATITGGTGGFAINGEVASDYSGGSVSTAGDVNGDGLADLIVGAKDNDTGGSNIGRSYVVFGKASGSVVSLATVAAGTGGFAINGEVADDNSGWQVSTAGDVNGDGLADLIVGAIDNDETAASAAKSYVVFGKSGTAAINLSSVAAGTGGFAIKGETAGDYGGYSVSTAGDVNGDGLADLIVGSPSSDAVAANAGRSYVVFGKSATTTVNLSDIVLGTGGFAINGEAANDFSGCSVSSAGDVNGDGLTDLIVGAYHNDTSGSNAGRSYIVFGKTNGAAVNLATIAAGTGGFAINGKAAGDESGLSVSAAGDVNGDGLADLIVGAPYSGIASSQAGQSYVVFGKSSGTAVNLSDVATGTGGFAINGEAAGDRSRTVATNVAKKNITLLHESSPTDRYIIASDTIADMTGNNGDGKKTYFYISGSLSNGTSFKQRVDMDTTATVNDLLIKIKDVYGGNVSVTLNSYGQIEIKDLNEGSSKLQFHMVATDNSEALTKATAGFTAGSTTLTLASTAGIAIGDLLNVEGIGQITVDGVNTPGAGQITFTATPLAAGAELGVTEVNVKKVLAPVSDISNLSASGQTVTEFMKNGMGVLSVGGTIKAWNDSMDHSVFNFNIELKNRTNQTYSLSTELLNTATGGVPTSIDLNGTNYAFTLGAASTVGDLVSQIQTALNTKFGLGKFTASLADGKIAVKDLLIDSAHSSTESSALTTMTLNTPADTFASINGIESDKVYFEKSGSKLTSNISQIVKTTNEYAQMTDTVLSASGMSATTMSGEQLTMAVTTIAGTTLTALIDTQAAASTFSPDGGMTNYTIFNSDSPQVTTAADSLTYQQLMDVISMIISGNIPASVATAADYNNAVQNAQTQVKVSLDNNGRIVIEDKTSTITQAGLSVYDSSTNTWFTTLLTNNSSSVTLNSNNAPTIYDPYVSVFDQLQMPVDDKYSGHSVSSAGDINGDGLADLIVGAPATYNGSAGKSYVVFGKSDTSAVSLATIATGVGGFVVNGETANDYSGHSVSSAGDVNGDGFADFIVGAYGNDTTASNAGKSYVVFGGSQWLTVSISGAGAINGTVSSEALIGSSSSDTITGGGGIDRFYSGDSDDVIVLTSSDITNLADNTVASQKAMINGGGDIDTIRLTTGANLDLTAIANQGASGVEENSRIESIEKIDMSTDTAANILTLTVNDVIDMSGMNLFNTSNGWTNGTYTLGASVSKHQIVIDGTAADSLIINAGNGVWANGGNVTNGAATYDVYNNTLSNSQILVLDVVGVVNNDA